MFKAMYHNNPAAVKKFKIDYHAMENGDPPMDTDLIRKEIIVLRYSPRLHFFLLLLTSISKLDHPNIMKFWGASVIMPNICIVTELLEHGAAESLTPLCPRLLALQVPWTT